MIATGLPKATKGAKGRMAPGSKTIPLRPRTNRTTANRDLRYHGTEMHYRMNSGALAKETIGPREEL